MNGKYCKAKVKYEVKENGYSSISIFGNKKMAIEFCNNLNKIYKKRYFVNKIKVKEFDVIKKFNIISKKKMKSNRIINMNNNEIISMFDIDIDT